MKLASMLYETVVVGVGIPSQERDNAQGYQDFGASKKVVELATMTGTKSMKGTPYLMASEVILQTGHSFPPHCLLLSEKTAEKSLAGGSSAQSLRFQNSFLSRIASIKLTILEQSSHSNQSPSPNPYEDNSTPLCSIQSTKLLPYLPLSSFSKTFPSGKQTSSGPQATSLHSFILAIHSICEEDVNPCKTPFLLHHPPCIGSSNHVADFFDETIGNGADVKLAANWIMGDVAAYMKNEKLSINEIKLTPQVLAELIASVRDGTISGKIDTVELMAKGGTVKGLIKVKDLVQIVDPVEIEKMGVKVLAKNSKQLEQYRGGKTKLQGFFVGQGYFLHVKFEDSVLWLIDIVVD
ncbi:hypothetical protein Vadar_023463 [Vaccinium darrowii]|uniref:Uncharacterized protein n=1 Tax=Vaccinium darrowii TaxID=229202 RepID=A0ACB7YXU3_9ERIC|nr:hypothetical protein Vadar_023463 [Vaccinium darrowii]